MSESMLPAGVRVVLVETSHPGNIGAVSRAMKNMGLSELVLVRPESFPDGKAYARASGAVDILDRARVVETLDEALGDCIEVVGTSARSRTLTWPVINPRECARLALDRVVQGPVALVFGREDNGLSNEELRRCHYHVQVPANPDYSSLNLGMAVQVITYELRMRYLESCEDRGQATDLQGIHNAADEGWDHPPATVQEQELFFEHLERTLITTGFHDPQRPRQLMVRMRRLFQRSHMDQMELNILRGILTSVDKLATGRVKGGGGSDQ